jgi:hypothetical protein
LVLTILIIVSAFFLILLYLQNKMAYHICFGVIEKATAAAVAAMN